MGLFLSMLGSSKPELVLEERIEKVKKEPKRYGTRFVIEGIEIYALNHKNAVRKYNNLKSKQNVKIS